MCFENALSGLRSYVDHRCVTHLYRIPMGSFNYVLDWQLQLFKLAKAN